MTTSDVQTGDNRWQRKARALAALAEDQRGKPEGDLAREKLLQVINKYPEAANFEPVKALVRRDLTMADIAQMKRDGISVTGIWMGETLAETIKLIEADFWGRIEKAGRKRLSASAAEGGKR